MLAKEGIQNYLKTLDSRPRGKDVKGCFKTFYETIKLEPPNIFTTNLAKILTSHNFSIWDVCLS